MQSAFWMVDNLWAMAIVVLPLAALSNASCTTFSDFESSAEVACAQCPFKFRGQQNRANLIQEQHFGIAQERAGDCNAF
jgi:hypothetical protein